MAGEPCVPHKVQNPNRTKICVFDTTSYRFSSRLLSDTLKQADSESFMSFDFDNPPLLVDGRKQMIEIPKLATHIVFFWRMPTPQGPKYSRRIRETVKLPFWVWWGRNVSGEYKVLWIERTTAPMRGKGNKLVNKASFQGDEVTAAKETDK